MAPTSAMTLTPGTRLGPYEVTSPIGAGGMGEVYRATDTRLKRDVAIKVLPSSLSADADRLARFQREAEVLAALNHPHIAAIYGVEDAAGSGGSAQVRALVMELVDGPTLADRIAEGPLPWEDAVAIARQIADALEAAHERGIVHRDLKPANVKIREDGTVKVLDFGLARPFGFDPARSGGDQADSPTITSPAMSRVGMILGTAAYMAPEQARGRSADKRVDIWAFGCVLFEMLTGQRAFPGDDVTDTLAAVVKLEPDWSALGPDVPAHVRQTLRVCLQKDPKRRGGDIAAVRLALEGAFDPSPDRAAPPAPPPARRASWAAMLASLVGGGLAAGALAWALWPSPAAPRVTRFGVDPPAGAALMTGVGQQTMMALSPDATKVVYRVLPQTPGALPRLVLRSFDAFETVTLFEGPFGSPFFSPDGAWVAFFAPDGVNAVIRKVAVTGGPPVTVGRIPTSVLPHGAAWAEDDTIYFGLHDTGLWRMPPAGGTAEPLPAKTPLPAAGTDKPIDRREWPALLPGSRHLLYSERSTDAAAPTTSRIMVRDLESGDERLLVSGGTFPQYVATGHLLFAAEGALRVVPFDLDRADVTGTPRPVLQGVLTRSEGAAEFRVSRDGSLAYVAGAVGPSNAELVWRSRSGAETPFGSGMLDTPRHPRLSPDGRRLALSVAGDIWVYFVDGRPPIRLSTRANYLGPLWSPDGTQLVVESPQGLVAIAADGSSSTPRPVSIEGHLHPHGWLNDGRDLLAVRLGTPTRTDILRWPLADPKAVADVLATPASEGGKGATVSPDGRWLAYVSDQTGKDEVWVRPVPGPGAPIRVSPSGGTDVTWSRNGAELYYLNGTRLLAVQVRAGAPPSFGTPVELFEAAPFRVDDQAPAFDVAPDGRFVTLKRGVSQLQPDRLVVVLNWAQELLGSPAR